MVGVMLEIQDFQAVSILQEDSILARKIINTHTLHFYLFNSFVCHFIIIIFLLFRAVLYTNMQNHLPVMFLDSSNTSSAQCPSNFIIFFFLSKFIYQNDRNKKKKTLNSVYNWNNRIFADIFSEFD